MNELETHAFEIRQMANNHSVIISIYNAVFGLVRQYTSLNVKNKTARDDVWWPFLKACYLDICTCEFNLVFCSVVLLSANSFYTRRVLRLYEKNSQGNRAACKNSYYFYIFSTNLTVTHLTNRNTYPSQSVTYRSRAMVTLC